MACKDGSWREEEEKKREAILKRERDTDTMPLDGCHGDPLCIEWRSISPQTAYSRVEHLRVRIGRAVECMYICVCVIQYSTPQWEREQSKGRHVGVCLDSSMVPLNFGRVSLSFSFLSLSSTKEDRDSKQFSKEQHNSSITSQYSILTAYTCTHTQTWSALLFCG